MKLYNITITGVLVVLTLSNSLPALQRMDFVGGSPGGRESLPREYPSLDVPKTIPDLSTITSKLTIEDTGAIYDINVKITIHHRWDEDLDVYLIAPDDTRIELFTDVGYDGDDFINTILVLDDEADQSIVDGNAPFTGSYYPEGNLNVLYGSDINGTWILEVTDDEWLISGDLISWSLIVDTRPLFEDTFPSTTIDTNKWPIVDGATIDDTAGSEPSPPYSLHLRNNDSVINSEINLSEFQSAELVFSWKRKSTESGDDFAVDYWDGNNWQNLLVLPSGDDSEWIPLKLELPPEAIQPHFRLCLQAMCDSYYDNWYIDDIEIRAKGIIFRLLGSTGFESRNTFSLVELKTNPVVEQLICQSRFYSCLDFNPVGVLYGGAGSILYIIDPVDCSYEIYKELDSSILISSISFAPDGTLYVLSTDQELYLIDPNTRTVIDKKPITGGYVWGIDFAPDGTLYGACFDLVIIDSDTGEITSTICDIFPIMATDLDFAPNSLIYTVDGNTLYKINPLNCTTSLEGTYESQLWGIASQVIEEEMMAQSGRYSMAGITINNPTKETGQDTELNILEEQALEAVRQHAIQSLR